VIETVENRKPPEPDILCEVRGRGRVAFELVDLIDQGLARTTARAVRGEKVGACWYGTPPLEAVRSKCQKRYETPHPIELVVCAGEEEVELFSPCTPTFEDRASQLIERSQFQRVWVVKLTGREKCVWFTGGKL